MLSSLSGLIGLLILGTRSREPQRPEVRAPATTLPAIGEVGGTTCCAASGIASGPNPQSAQVSAGDSDAHGGDLGEHSGHEDVHLEQI